MSITVKFACDGCNREAPGTRFLLRHFKSFSGKRGGFGRYSYDDAQSVAPDGWQAFDLYTGACYCPECWASIEQEAANG